MKEAKYYIKKNDELVECLLCPVKCIIKKDNLGKCGVRKNINGILYNTTYNKIITLAIDPIEKKPLYHFYPGSKILSLGNIGCNLHCTFCQNCEISQIDFEKGQNQLKDISINELIKIAFENDSIGIAYTYNEPLINFEFVLDCSKEFKKHNLKNVIVSNGLINEEPLNELSEYLDAANIDLKSINEEFYKEICLRNNDKINKKTGKGFFVNSILSNIEFLYKKNIVVEVTNLVITDLNDDIEELKLLISEIANISKNIPLHFSRYFPRYNLNNKITDKTKLLEIYNIAKQKLNFVHLGNI